MEQAWAASPSSAEFTWGMGGGAVWPAKNVFHINIQLPADSKTERNWWRFRSEESVFWCFDLLEGSTSAAYSLWCVSLGANLLQDSVFAPFQSKKLSCCARSQSLHRSLLMSPHPTFSVLSERGTQNENTTHFKLQPRDSERRASESQLSISLCQQHPVEAPGKNPVRLCVGSLPLWWRHDALPQDSVENEDKGNEHCGSNCT